MFPTSTQCKHWMFSCEEVLNQLREEANNKHIQIYGRNVNVNNHITFIFNQYSTIYFQDANKYEYFLTPDEEKIMVKNYELRLRDFCKRFQPPMPRCVIGTAFHYFKRFYIHNSVMNHHPKEIM